MLANALRTAFHCLSLVVAFCLPLHAQEAVTTARGETIFVPAYPEVVTAQGRREKLQVSMIVHNADPVPAKYGASLLISRGFKVTLPGSTKSKRNSSGSDTASISICSALSF